jgi:hypothetical protein
LPRNVLRFAWVRAGLTALRVLAVVLVLVMLKATGVL